MAKLTEEAQAALAEAFAIVKEDRILKRLRELGGPVTDTDPKGPKAGDPPPPKAGDPVPPVPVKKGGAYWGLIEDD